MPNSSLTDADLDQLERDIETMKSAGHVHMPLRFATLRKMIAVMRQINRNEVNRGVAA